VLVHALRAGLGANAIRELLAFLGGEHSFDSIDSVPKGADDMKVGGCRELGITPSENALVKILDVRSFMASNQAERERLVKLKFQIIPELLRGKKRLLLDDSIVR
jgi:amidophosphoribosyltransferase